MNVKQFKTAIPALFDAKITPLVIGPRGVGKSECIKQVITEMGGMMEDFRLGQCADVGDLTGLLDIANSDDFCTFKIPERIHRLIQFCENNPDSYGVFFFDEVNRAPKDILQAVFQVVLDHELNGLKFPKNLRCVCAQNPATDDYSVTDMNDDALNDRFCHIRFEPTSDDWLEYAKSVNVDPTIISYIDENRDALNSTYQDFELEVKFSPRSWMRANALLNVCPPGEVFNELLLGIVGTEKAAEYLAHRKKVDRAITGEEILDNYASVQSMIQSYSSVDGARNDLLRLACNNVRDYAAKLESLTNDQEQNFADFICDIPRDLGHGYLFSEVLDIPAFMKTERDSDIGITTNQQLMDAFRGWKQPEEEGNTEVATDE